MNAPDDPRIYHPGVVRIGSCGDGEEYDEQEEAQ